MKVGLSLGSFQALRIVLLLSLLLTVPGSPDASDPFGLQGRVPRTAQQGGVFALTLRPAAWMDELRGNLGNQSLVFSRVGRGRMQALVGVDLEAAGRLLLRLEGKDPQGQVHVRKWPIQVRPRRFAVQRLTLHQHMVELDPETATRVSEEAGRLKALWEAATPERLWRGAFLSPVISGAKPEGFGLRRIINNQPRSPHSGADYKAPRGSVVRAPNAGRVTLAEEQFFGGNVLVLDHGNGLYTLYFHLQDSLVKPGDLVQKGQEVGRVGATGRATGPHLHFGVRLNGARIDPAALLRLSLL